MMCLVYFRLSGFPTLWSQLLHWRACVLPKRMITHIMILVFVALSGCSSSVTVTSVPAIAVVAMTPHPLTFYEGEDSIEPFAPFYVSPGPQGTVNMMGFAQREGAYYVASYLSMNWNITGVSNGFAPSDPQWECDTSPEDAIAISPTVNFLARPCADGSVTVFSLPDALPVLHLPAMGSSVGLTSRKPVAVFSPDGTQMALTDDSPLGPGSHIDIYSTQTWQSTVNIALSPPLLSRPAWSHNGQDIAAVDMSGSLHIWNAMNGQPVASAAIPNFSQGDAAVAQSGPAPMWSPDDRSIISATPTGTASLQLTKYAVQRSQLAQLAQSQVPVLPNIALPMLAADGQFVFLHVAPQHGQLFAAQTLQQVSDFALAGSRVLWSATGHVLFVFTVNATEITMKID